MRNRIAGYAALVKSMAPKSKVNQGLFRAFWVGGLICCIGQGIQDVFANLLGWGYRVLRRLQA